MNGNGKIFFVIGALGLAGWLIYRQTASAATGGDASGVASGDPSGGGASGAVGGSESSPLTWLTNMLQRAGQSLGVAQPRGIRNNNPGNLRYVASIQWVGQIGDDGNGYAVFDTAEHGIRALGHQLMTYMSRGLTTVQTIISTWAPTNENDTAAYISDVASRVGVDPSDTLDQTSIPALAQAIIIHENGSDPYGLDSITQWATEP